MVCEYRGSGRGRVPAGCPAWPIAWFSQKVTLSMLWYTCTRISVQACPYPSTSVPAAQYGRHS
eukprot:3931596-Rhodomonas_salina.4